ncbi:MAG: Mo-dependent nitrogenase C-terminal domain-containing protein [Leptolyngbyaceae cyanobacterium bins.59]|nr:Mo-dependent nitrogenase C-terminal domain-containing protein [Leptolyngbyaceae cyanobacterium bins.59]
MSHLVSLHSSETSLEIPRKSPRTFRFEPFKPIRQWLDRIEVNDQKAARLYARLIPAQCPFERDILLFGKKVGHIPPLCKFNPFYEELVALRFRALCYLVDQCGEDIQAYC